MIRKIRRRFIRVTMFSVALVLFFIIGTINILNYRDVTDNADRILDVLAANDGAFPDKPEDYKPDRKPDEEGSAPANIITEETPFESRFFSVSYNADGTVKEADTSNIAAVDTDTAESYASDVLHSASSKGFFHFYRYSISLQSDGSSLVVFLDCQRSLGSFRTFLLTSVIVSLAGFAAVFVLVLLFSRQVVRPAEESYQKQRRFITDAGHELKTPLTIIDADVSVLEMDTGSSEWIDNIRAQTERLTKLTNDLIYLARMDENSAELQMIDFPISDMVSETAQSFRSRALIEGKTFLMDITPMLTYCGDEKALTKLVSTLLDNALKYSDDRGTIRLTLRKDGKGVLLTVYNTADSIDKETIAHMFDRFYRADPSRNSAKQGYGIGLSIASAVTDAHKGKIKASSPGGKSMQIAVWLPDKSSKHIS